jgi:hypothetical protein
LKNVFLNDTSSLNLIAFSLKGESGSQYSSAYGMTSNKNDLPERNVKKITCFVWILLVLWLG